MLRLHDLVKVMDCRERELGGKRTEGLQPHSSELPPNTSAQNLRAYRVDIGWWLPWHGRLTKFWSGTSPIIRIKPSTPPYQWLNATWNWCWASRKNNSLLMTSDNYFWQNVIQSNPAVGNQVYIWAYIRLPSPKKRRRLGQHVRICGVVWRRAARYLWKIKEILVPTILGVASIKSVRWFSIRRI